MIFWHVRKSCLWEFGVFGMDRIMWIVWGDVVDEVGGMMNENIVDVEMITDSSVLDADVVAAAAADGGGGDTMKLCLCRAVVAEPPKPKPTPSESAAILHGGNIF
jgi:hypothetical protein